LHPGIYFTKQFGSCSLRRVQFFHLLICMRSRELY
jgi:hypothetical protein